MTSPRRPATLLRTGCSLLLVLIIVLSSNLADGRVLLAEEPPVPEPLVAVVQPLPEEPADVPSEPPAEAPADVQPQASPTPAADMSRFGVAVNAQQRPLGYYDEFGDLQVTWYQNWSYVPWWNKEIRRPEFIPGVQFYPTVGAWEFLEGKETVADLQNMMSLCPACFPDGTVWIVGNELQVDRFSYVRAGVPLNPARVITPQEYAVKYKKYYDMIKGLNPSFQVAIGVTFDRPTWTEFLRETRLAYEAQYGVRMPIDVYTMHGYMSDPPLTEVTLLINNKRQRMKEYGDQNKPLLVTETGVLTDRGIGLVATDAQIRAYMNEVFTYLATYTSYEYGCPDDGFRMVQKWAWFALTAANGDNSDLDRWDGTDLFETGGVTADLNALGQNYADYPKSLPPAMPWFVWGNTRVGGTKVAAGTPVSAWIDNVRVARGTTQIESNDSVYMLQVSADNPDTPWRDGGTADDTVRFQIGSSWAAQTGTWQEGRAWQNNLTIPAYATRIAASTEWWDGWWQWVPISRYPKMVGDVDGDGRADIVGINPDKGVMVGLSTGSSFGRPTNWTTELIWIGDLISPRKLGDVNGDGKADLVAFKSGEGVYVALSDGTKFGAATLWSTAFSDYDSQTSRPRTVGDVNGDGKADIVGFHNTEGVYVGLSNGASFETPTLWTTQFAYANDNNDHRELADVNGDGRADIVAFRYNQGVFAALSTGAAFASSSKWFDGFKVWRSQARYVRHAADLNGDGLADIIAFNPDNLKAIAVLSSGAAFTVRTTWTN
ncbi:MAG: hypothetical protein GX557_07095, partial [Chloroflexi bacterium]|nr:hypothetical protein [Chloroflexota bacterium]